MTPAAIPRFMLVCLLVLASVVLASADTTVNFLGVTASTGFPGDYEWSYSATLSAGDTVCPSVTTFTLNNVGGEVSLQAPLDWGASGSGTFTVTAGDCSVTLTSPDTFETFTVVSTFGTGFDSTYSWAGSSGSGSGTVEVPGVAPVTGTREPSGAFLLAGGLGLVVGMFRRRFRAP